VGVFVFVDEQVGGDAAVEQLCSGVQYDLRRSG
jgi:hypothetical protein